MFAELLDGELYTAKRLATKWPSEVLKTEARFETLLPRDIVLKAKVNHFSNIVLTQGSRPIGWIPTSVVERYPLKSKMIKEYDNWKISSTIRLPDLVKRFQHDGARTYPLYFVEDETQRLTGIMTWADLNRKSVYLYNYILLLFLELWIKRTIMRRQPSGDGRPNVAWIQTLKSVHARSLKNRELGRTRFDEIVNFAENSSKTYLEACQFKDLTLILRFGLTSIMSEEGLSADVLNFACRLRNRVAHPTNLIVSPRKADAELAKIGQFWGQMNPLLLRYDDNAKNRSRSILP